MQANLETHNSIERRSSRQLRLVHLEHYALAVLSVGIALGVSLLLQHFHFRDPAVPLLLLAVAVSSWYGGTGPAALAFLLCVVGFYWYFVEPVRTIYIYSSEIPFFIVFVGFAVLLSWFGVVRRRAERALRDKAEALRTSEEHLAEAQSVSHTGSWYLDIAHNRLSWSDEVFRIFGMQLGTPLTYETFLAAVYADDRAFVNEAWNKAMRGAPYDIEHRILVGREVRWVRERARLEFGVDGTATKGIGTVQDITERKLADEAVREKAALLDLTHDTVFVMDINGMIKYWNRGAQERYGWAPEQAVGRVVHDMLKTVFPAPLEELKAEVIHTGRWEGELVHTRKDGTQLVVASRWALQCDRGGAPVAILETNNDISERKRAEEDLRRLNRELRAISDCNQVLLRATDEQSLVQQVCRIVCEEAGYPMAFVAYAENDDAKTVRPVAWTGVEEGHLVSAGLTWADTEHGRGPTGTAIRSGKSCCIQNCATDLRVAPWREGLAPRGFRSMIAVPLKDEDGNSFGCLTIHSAEANAFTPEEIRLVEELAGDLAFGIVTLRSWAARERAEQQVALLRFALDNVREVALLIDEWGRFHYVNEEASRVLGYTREELLGMDAQDVDVDFTAERWQDHWRDIKGHPLLIFESRHRARDGRVFPVEVSSNYFEYQGQVYNLALVRDITERKRAEESLRRSQAYLAESQRLTRTGSWAQDAATRMTLYWSEETYRIWGFDPQAGLPTWEQIIERIHPQDLEKHKEATERALCENADLDFEYRIVLPDGAVKDLHTLAHPVLSPTGEILEVVGTTVEITERKRAEQRLRQNEAYLAESQRLSHTGSWALDVATERYAYVSQECLRIYGFDSDESLPTREAVFQRIHPEDRDRVERVFHNALREKIDSTDELRIVLPDGTVKNIQVIRHPLLNRAGDVVELVGTSIDITERKRAEQELREREALFRLAISSVELGVYEWDAASDTSRWENERMFEIFGRTRAEGPISLHKFRTEVMEPEDLPAFDRVHSEAMRSDRIFKPVCRIRRHNDGEQRWIEFCGRFEHAADGSVKRNIGVLADITERKRREEALRQSEAYLAEAQRLSHTGSWAFEIASDKYSYISEEDSRIWGLDPQEGSPNRETIFRRIIPEDRKRVQESFQRCVRKKVDTSDEYRIVLPDGTFKDVHTIRHPVLNSAGKVVRLVGTSVDITERKRAEEALRESETRFRTFVDHASDALFVYDLAQGTVVDVNRSACGELGYTREELVGMDPMAFHLSSDRAELESAVARAAAGEAVVGRHWHRRKDGSTFPVEVHTSLVLYRGRHFLLKVARDITDRVRAEEQREKLRQLEAEIAHLDRLTMLGELTASIAHEVNQPLSGVVSNGSACLRWLAGDAPNVEEARETARRIVRDGKRAAEVIARVRALIKKSAVLREKLNLNDTVREVLALVGDEAKRNNVTIQTQFADDIFAVLGDRVQLQQVLLNLVMNAVDAMKSICGRTRELVVTTRNIDSDQVQVTVEDSGVGLDAALMTKIFEPFYTTKAGGMGMGLSICRSILNAHGGRLWATAKDGRPGTMFHFALPTHREEGSNGG
jgi:PAS domain S-box-containing protein